MINDKGRKRKRILGRVKWFNSKLGYGFITHRDKKNNDMDIFVHWSNLLLSDKEYHTLYKGEFVEFEIETCICSNNNSNGIQACKVSGPNNTQLLTAIKETIPQIQSTNVSTSQVFNIKQLELCDLTSSDHYSQKAIQIYFNC
jgi:cold shock CspA family protein